MTYDPVQIREDFDRIAAHDDGLPSHHDALHERLLAHVPPGASRAIDLGCGSGAFTRALAERCRHVMGLDLSPRMIERAHAHAPRLDNVEWRTGNFMEESFGDGAHDVVSALATLHHMPLEGALARAAALVRPGGVLVVVDLFQPTGLTGLKDNAVSWLWSRWLDRGAQRTPEFRSAWRAHGAHDRYPTMGEILAIAARVTPGAEIRKHLLWRWSLVWRRPRDPYHS